MDLIEIVPAHGYEHRRKIRRMARGVVGPSPVWGALVEFSRALLSFAVMVAFSIAFFSWWMCL